MKTVKTILAAFFILAFANTQAQTTLPQGYTAGSITLTDGAVKTGYIKDNTVKKASINFMEAAGGKAKTYDGWELTAANTATARYNCIRGDFFTVLCQGELSFLQKTSQAKAKIDYNGSEPILRNASEGKAGDYFVYHTANRELVMVTPATYDQVSTALFKNYEPAISKAKENRANPALLQQAVEIYNQRPAK